MWIKIRGSVVAINGNAIIRREGSTIRLELTDGPRLGHSTRIADYVNPDRAKEVVADFWKIIMAGGRGYEFPEV